MSLRLNKFVSGLLFVAVAMTTQRCDKDPQQDLQVEPEIVNVEGSGKIQANVSVLMLHPGNSAHPPVRLYNSDGTIVIPQPNFDWEADSPIVSISNGTITAKEVGSTQITITDRAHGNAYIDVVVVPDSITIPDGPVNVAFFPFVLAVNVNSSGTELPLAVLSDYAANEINGAVTYEIMNEGEGVSIAGGKLIATSPGVYHLKAKVGGDYLHGDLFVSAYGDSQADSRNTNFTVLDFPSQFNKYGVTSRSIKIHVLESGWKNNQLFFDFYETVPEQVSVEYPGVLQVVDGVNLKSIFPGYTPVTISFHGESVTANALVAIDFTGNWKATGPGGKVYNFCMSPPVNTIVYNATNYLWPEHAEAYAKGGGDAYIGLADEVVGDHFYMEATESFDLGVLDGTAKVAQIWPFKDGVIVNDTGVDGIPGYLLYWKGKLDEFNMMVNESTLVLKNGLGDCELPETDPDMPDQELLYGQWKLVSETYQSPESPDVFNEELNGCQLGVIYEFTEAGEYFESVVCGPDGVEDGTFESFWTLTDSTLVIEDDESYIVRELNNTSLKLILEYEDTGEVITSTYQRQE
jgi:hypothetical protein